MAKAAGCCFGGQSCISEPALEVQHSTDALSRVWQGGGRCRWPLLCNERLSDHIGYLITKLSDISLGARNLEMQRMDLISNLTFSEHQKQMERGARSAPKREFFLLFRVRAVSWGVGGGSYPGTFCGFQIQVPGIHLVPTGLLTWRQLLLSQLYFHVVPSLLDTHIRVTIFDTSRQVGRNICLTLWTGHHYIPCIMLVTVKQHLKTNQQFFSSLILWLMALCIQNDV